MTRILLVSAALAVLVACSERKPEGKARIEKGEALRVEGRVSLLERSGTPFTAEDLRGKVWVASLIFTRCQTTCIPMCYEMAALQEEFANEPDFVIVAASVDPVHDTAEVLDRFGKGYDADPKRWLFLTGTEADIGKFAVDVLRLPWNTEDPVTHSVDFVLVDRDGKIRDYFRQNQPGAMKRMREVIRTVLAEKAS